MKKIFSSAAIAAGLCFKGIYAFAEPTDTLFLDRVEAIDYVLLAGAGLFLLGMLFILLSMYAGIKNRKVSESEFDTYDEYVYNDADNAVNDGDYDSEEAYDFVATEDTEAEETVYEPETEEEFEPEIEDKDEDEGEAEIESEEVIPEEEGITKPQIRITLTGTNNSDVKIMEFADKATVGRRSNNDIIISDNAVSGNHCEFVYEEGSLYIADLDSTNGTLVNDEPVIRAEIKSGDTIIIGKHRYKVNVTI